MVELFNHCIYDLKSKAPSIDTPLHGLLPFKHIDHLHPDALIAIAASKEGEAITKEIFKGELAWVPWQRPGFDLGLKLEKALADNPGIRGIVLGGHGLFTWGDTAYESYINTLDTIEQAKAVAEASLGAGMRIPAMIEIDCDGHRSGVVPSNRGLLLDIGRVLAAGAELRGVLTHAGGSYAARGAEALRQCAEDERRGVVDAATILRAAGLPCPVVSLGSTPTAHSATDLSGVTEVRAGVFVFFDLVMAGIGVCQIDDIALSVMATVIGHQREKGWILVDAGWMAMSQDRGTSKQAVSQGYGLVCDIEGQAWPDLILADANQEHGIITVRPGSGATLPDLAIGDRVRILPNHACATGAQHRSYQVVRGRSAAVEAEWPRFGGW
eukprot:gene42732-53012_t